MVKIIPTILEKKKKAFEERFSLLTSISKEIQIDFMDKKFVKNKSVFLEDIPNLKSKDNKFEAHLMVKNPKDWLGKLKRKGFYKVLFHYSAHKNEENVFETIKKSKKLGLKTFLAINPEISVKKIGKFLKRIDGVLIMGVHPGKENQKLLPSTINRVNELKEKSKRIKIQVDGGVNDKNISKLSKAGIDFANSGSFISDSENPLEALQLLRRKSNLN